MKNEIIKRNILITGIASLLFLVLSLFIMSYSTFNNLKEELIDMSDLVISNLDLDSLREDIEEVTDNQDWLTIVVSDNTGRIYIDSDNSAIGYSSYGVLEESELFKADLKLDTDRLYTNGKTIYYIKRINEDVIIRTSTLYEGNLSFILSGIFAMLIIMTIEIFLSYLLSKKTSEKVEESFNDIQDSLKNINEGTLTKSELTTTYDEIEPIIKEINKINNNISDNIKVNKAERKKLSLVVNKLEEGIFITDLSGNILLLNESARGILEIEEEVKLPMSYKDLKVNEIFIEKIKNTIENRNNNFFDYNHELRKKVYFVSIGITKMTWEGVDSDRLVFVTFRDVTDDRKASMIKSNFIANASHELKTPITSIIGFSELLSNSKDKLDDKSKKYVETIHSESVRMKALIEDLIYLSNLEEKDEPKDDFKEKIYLKDEIINICERLKVNNPLNITFDLNEIDDTYVVASLIDITRLLTNLIENAFKYNKMNGSIKIKVHEHENYITMYISDTGIGISEADLSRIFERFYRVDKSRNQRVSGTGLGLNIVKEICDNLNAKLHVNSKLGEGTEFKITFNKE